jgi:hypothetical protein
MTSGITSESGSRIVGSSIHSIPTITGSIGVILRSTGGWVPSYTNKGREQNKIFNSVREIIKELDAFKSLSVCTTSTNNSRTQTTKRINIKE